MTDKKTRMKVRISDRWEAAYLQAKGHIGADMIDELTRKTVFEFNDDRPRRQIVGQDALNLLHGEIERIADDVLRASALESFAVLEKQLKEAPPIEMTLSDDLKEYNAHGLVAAKSYKQECQICSNRIRQHNQESWKR